MKKIRIDPLSAQCLHLEGLVNKKSLFTATGFLVERGEKKYLVTNWHVAAGRYPDTDQPVSPTAGIPEELAITCHVKGVLGGTIPVLVPLHHSGTPLWLEHPLGKKVDVVALPVSLPGPVEAYCFDLGLASVDLQTMPAMPVAIIGFPYGLVAGGSWPIWKTGHIATDPDVDYDGRPAFLIDATTRSGMSGSPVVARANGGYTNVGGRFVIGGGTATKFLGVYSGRIHQDAELGRVWRPSVIEDIFQKAGV